jgi:hypothetical protein
MPMSWMQALVTYHKALKQNPESAEVTGKVNRLTQLGQKRKDDSNFQACLTNS